MKTFAVYRHARKNRRGEKPLTFTIYCDADEETGTALRFWERSDGLEAKWTGTLVRAAARTIKRQVASERKDRLDIDVSDEPLPRTALNIRLPEGGKRAISTTGLVMNVRVEAVWET